MINVTIVLKMFLSFFSHRGPFVPPCAVRYHANDGRSSDVFVAISHEKQGPLPPVVPAGPGFQGRANEDQKWAEVEEEMKKP